MNAPLDWYRPSDDLLSAVKSIFPRKYMPWDKYYLNMAQADFFDGRHENFASKTFFIRQAPFEGQFAVLGGLTEFLRQVHELEFDASYVRPLERGGCRPEFIDYLLQLKKLRLKVHSLPEGSLFFAHEPAIVLEGDLLSLRLAEGMLLPCVNPSSLFVTKWLRVNMAAAPGEVMDFSPRRAQNSDRSSFYSILGGCALTSNSEMEKGLPLVATGTMGHEFIQSYGNEKIAFDKWLTINPDKPVLLVDTVDTLKSGLPNAIDCFKKHWPSIVASHGTPAIRLDSGDLAYLSMEAYFSLQKNLQEEQKNYQPIKIILTNDLDEYRVEEIKQQIFTNCDRAGVFPQDLLKTIIFACGTRPGTCHDQPSLGGVAKLSSIGARAETARPVIKLAFDNPIKTSIPGNNRSALIWNQNELICCLIYHCDENIQMQSAAYHPDDDRKLVMILPEHQKEVRHHLVFDSFSDASKKSSFIIQPKIQDVIQTMRQQVNRLHWTHKRLTKPHQIKVSLSKKIYQLRANMILNRSLIQ